MSGVRGGIGVVIVHVCVSVLLGLSLSVSFLPIRLSSFEFR